MRRGDEPAGEDNQLLHERPFSKPRRAFGVTSLPFPTAECEESVGRRRYAMNGSPWAAGLGINAAIRDMSLVLQAVRSRAADLLKLAGRPFLRASPCRMSSGVRQNAADTRSEGASGDDLECASSERRREEQASVHRSPYAVLDGVLEDDEGSNISMVAADVGGHSHLAHLVFAGLDHGGETANRNRQ